MVRALLKIVVALALVASLAIPAQAQSATAGSDAELRAWFDGLGKNRQEELKHRYRALKRLPKDRQAEILKAAKEGRPILTEEQRKNLGKLRKLSYLQRVRLYTLAAELQAIRKFRPADFDAAMKSDDRASELGKLLAEQRRAMFMRSLAPDQRRELMNMPPRDRERTIREMYEQESKARLAELEGFHPRVAELRDVADKGDKDARKQLKQMLADLKTLDLLLQRLEPEKRKEVMAELRELSMDDAAGKIRKALQNQWQAEMKRNKDNGREPRIQPERNGNRNPENRRKPRD